MADFNNLTPPKSVTDPKGQREGFQPFPAHMHKADGEYIVVVDEAGKAQALKDGYKELPFSSERVTTNKKK